MASLRDLRRKIKSVTSTEQITKAMKMVAAARMRRSQSAIISARPFAVKMEGLIRGLEAERRELLSSGEVPAGVRTFFESPAEGEAGLILITADKGLCGAFNTVLMRAALDWLRGHKGKVHLALVGRKGRDFLRRLKGLDCEVEIELAGIFPRVGFQHAEVLGKAVPPPGVTLREDAELTRGGLRIEAAAGVLDASLERRQAIMMGLIQRFREQETP